MKKLIASLACAFLLCATPAFPWWSPGGDDNFDPSGDDWNSSWTPGSSSFITNSYDFNGTDQYVSVADHNDFSFTDGSDNDSAFSVCFWYKVDAGGPDTFVSKYETNKKEWYFGYTTSEEYVFYTYDESVNEYIGRETPPSYDADTWKHMCGTYDGNECAVDCNTSFDIYEDGAAVDDADFTSNPGYIGMENLGSAVDFGKGAVPNLNGHLALVVITSDVMTTAEIASARSNACAGMSVDNVVACYDLGTDVLDDSGNGHDGTAEPSGGTPVAPSSPVDKPTP